ncbi:MAG: hypothetical protein ACRDRQ_17610 [Pseudonocardiaceae bacterium]
MHPGLPDLGWTHRWPGRTRSPHSPWPRSWRPCANWLTTSWWPPPNSAGSIGRIPAGASPEAQRAAAIRLGRELGAPPWFLKAQRDRTGSMLQVGELRRAAAEVAAGTARPQSADHSSAPGDLPPHMPPPAARHAGSDMPGGMLIPPADLGKRVQRGRCGRSWQVSTCHRGTRMFSQVARARGVVPAHRVSPATPATGGRAGGRMADRPYSPAVSGHPTSTPATP